MTYPAKLIEEFPWEIALEDALSEVTGQVMTKRIWREPAGVVGAIVPWNFPFEVTINKIGQALATGNTVVLKPAPDTPFNATLLGRLIAERTDIPAGVVNVVVSSDHLTGEELTLSPEVDLISFTGSTAVGKRIMEKGAATMKRLFLELGGKSATIVLDDAELELACLIGMAPCMHAGQGCAIPTRMLLPRSRYDEGVAILKSLYESIVPGDPQEAGVLCGPVISDKQRQRILGYIQKGIDEGATLEVGGTGKPDGLDKGFYVRPTLFTNVDNQMTIAQEEIFGPVLVVIPFDDDEDALRIANDSQYGLAGNVMAGSLDRALGVAHRLRAGFIGVNGGAPYFADMPFGGYKSSGVGRQNGIAGFEQYLEVKSVAWPADVIAGNADSRGGNAEWPSRLLRDGRPSAPTASCAAIASSRSTHRPSAPKSARASARPARLSLVIHRLCRRPRSAASRPSGAPLRRSRVRALRQAGPALHHGRAGRYRGRVRGCARHRASRVADP